jgi:heterodisulfide reductase subunit B
MPGCSASSSAKAYDSSFKAVSNLLGLELVEIPDWNCCGANVVYSFDRKLATFLVARNLALAEKMGLDLVTTCSGCYQTHSRAAALLNENAELKNEANSILSPYNLRYDGKIRVKHALETIVKDVGLKKVSEKVSKPLKGLRIIPYYGCAVVRPKLPNSFDDPYNPVSLDRLIEALGGEAVYFTGKTRCCGGPLLLKKSEVAYEMAKQLLLKMKETGAHCAITPCPFCHLTLEIMQPLIETTFNVEIDFPILYFTQLMGLAFGFSAKKMGLNKHMVSAEGVLAQLEKEVAPV